MKIRSYISLCVCLLIMGGTLQGCDKLKEHFSDSRGSADRGDDEEDEEENSRREDVRWDPSDREDRREAPEGRNRDDRNRDDRNDRQNSRNSGPFYGVGNLDSFPYSLDISIEGGQVSGTFWNILYDIKLPVTGTLTHDGVLSLNLGTGNSQSHLEVRSSDGLNFSGVWGKNNKPVSLKLHHGTRNTAPGNYSGQKITIKGGGMTTHALLVDNSSGCFFYFPNQPAGNRLPMTADYSAGTYRLSDPNTGNWLATIKRNGNTGTIENSSGKCFDVIFE